MNDKLLYVHAQVFSIIAHAVLVVTMFVKCQSAQQCPHCHWILSW